MLTTRVEESGCLSKWVRMAQRRNSSRLSARRKHLYGIELLTHSPKSCNQVRIIPGGDHEKMDNGWVCAFYFIRPCIWSRSGGRFTPVWSEADGNRSGGREALRPGHSVESVGWRFGR